MKNIEKEKAVELRKRGYSFSEISEKIRISKSTASLWTRPVKLSKQAVERLNNRSLVGKFNSKKTHNKMKEERILLAEKDAQKFFDLFEDSKLIKLALLSIMYWCEGIKHDGTLSFTNSDSNLVSSFLKLLRDVFKIDERKLRVCIHLHDYHIENKVKKYWSDITKIPQENFIKSFKKDSNHLNKKDGYMGCIRITYHNAHTARVILSFAKKIMKLYS